MRLALSKKQFYNLTYILRQYLNPLSIRFFNTALPIASGYFELSLYFCKHQLLVEKRQKLTQHTKYH